jgi:hypothetical protein|tara:strand:- start:258 stop:458 length:201 start_codon:yes stop_codon:yes gene_type:complete
MMLSQFAEVDDGRPKEKDFEVKNTEPSSSRLETAPFVAQFVSALFGGEVATSGLRQLRLVRGPPSR